MINSPAVYILNTYGALLLLLGVLAYLFFVKKHPEQGYHVIFAVIVTYFVCLILKNLFDVSRPFIVNGGVPEAGLLDSGSFPSFHTALAFVTATTVSLHDKRLGVILFVLAALVGIGRVVANVHYPVDIAFGAILGALIAVFTEKIHFRR